MDKKIRRAALVMFAVFSLTLGAIQSTPAQPNNEPEHNGVQWRAMRVRNLRPGMLAWWLDPKNNPEPVEYRLSHADDETSIVGSHTPEGASPFKLDGIQAIHAVDSQNILYALGDAAAWEKFQRHVQFLDKPIPQVEIEMKRVEIAEEDAIQAGWWKMKLKPADIIILPTSKYEETMGAMTKAGRVKTINDSRITAMNNLPASFGTAQLGPAKVTLDTGVAPTSGQAFASVAYPNTEFMMKREWRTTATPTMNNDGSVTLLLNLAEPVYLVRGTPNDYTNLLKEPRKDPYQRPELPKFLLEKGNKLTSIVNLNADETVLLANWNEGDWAPTVVGNVAQNDKPTRQVIFVSVRRINTNQ
jgi:hypothetical protein